MHALSIASWPLFAGMNITRKIKRAAALASKIGFINTAKIAQASYLRLTNAIRLSLHGYDYPIELRCGDSSDLAVFNAIFVRGEYSPIDHLSPSLIVDCGANAGYSSVYFMRRFPQSRVIAIEPDPANIAICRRNLAPYGQRVTLVQGAIWSQRTSLVMMQGQCRDRREWATQVREAEAGEVPDVEAFDIPSLVPPGQRISLLKVDIEGAEKQLFGSSFGAWIQLVDNIVIELHDAQAEEILFKALEGYEYQVITHGELTICTGIRPAS